MVTCAWSDDTILVTVYAVHCQLVLKSPLQYVSCVCRTTHGETRTHTVPYSPVSPTFGQTAFKFRELFSAFSRSAATPHQSRRQGGALSPASVSFHFVGKGPLFYKKHPPFHFLTKNTPHFISRLRACTADSAVDHRAGPSVDYHLLPFFFLAPRASLPG